MCVQIYVIFAQSPPPPTPIDASAHKHNYWQGYSGKTVLRLPFNYCLNLCYICPPPPCFIPLYPPIYAILAPPPPIFNPPFHPWLPFFLPVSYCLNPCYIFPLPPSMHLKISANGTWDRLYYTIDGEFLFNFLHLTFIPPPPDRCISVYKITGQGHLG